VALTESSKMDCDLHIMIPSFKDGSAETVTIVSVTEDQYRRLFRHSLRIAVETLVSVKYATS